MLHHRRCDSVRGRHSLPGTGSRRRSATMWLLSAGILVVSAVQATAQEAQHQLRAGAATSNITPALGAIIVGGWGQPRATHIHDELHARCLVLDDGQTQLAFVVCDNVGIPREVFDMARRMAQQETGLPAWHMMMSATHTHSGPSARGQSALLTGAALDDYQAFLARRIVDGLRRAQHNLQPARIGWGSAQLPEQVFNRRWLLKPGTPNPNPFGGEDQARMNPGAGNPNLLKPAGPVDPEISFLSVQTAEGRPLALLANYSLHYVGGVPAGDISADYFAIFAERIGELLDVSAADPPFVGIMTNGTSGDVNNIDVLAANRRRMPPYAKMRIVANQAAAVVFKELQTTEYADWVPLAAEQTEIPLQVRRPDSERLAWARDVLSKPEGAPQAHIRERVYAERVLQLAEWPEQIPCALQVFRIGDVGVAAIPFEVFTETGLEIKQRSPFDRAFTVSLANGAYGYLPTRSQHELGGYETWMGTSRVEVDAAHQITDALLEMLEALHKQSR
jgi:neutral ceramidase